MSDNEPPQGQFDQSNRLIRESQALYLAARHTIEVSREMIKSSLATIDTGRELLLNQKHLIDQFYRTRQK